VSKWIDVYHGNVFVRVEPPFIGLVTFRPISADDDVPWWYEITDLRSGDGIRHHSMASAASAKSHGSRRLNKVLVNNAKGEGEQVSALGVERTED